MESGDNATVRFDLDNEPQPDVFLRILPACGGQSRTAGGHVEGAPEPMPSSSHGPDVEA